MKVSTYFFIIVLVIAITYSALVALGNSGIKLNGLFADISSSLRFENSIVGEKKIQTQNSDKIITSKKTTAKRSPTIQNEEKIKVTIHTSAYSYYHPSLITLNLSVDTKTNITGWKIKTRKGEFVIPQGQEKYNSYMSNRDIFALKYDTLYIVSEKSPLGTNFKSNRCLGYINRTDIYPSLWTSCPSKTNVAGFSSLTPSCQDYISFSYGCQTPNYSSNLTITMDSACVAFINQHYTYSGCFADNSNNENFLGSSWYIYSSTDLVDPLHDTIYLYNKSGNLISQYSY
jgi:hypothetical protein